MRTHLKLLMSGAAISCMVIPAPAILAQTVEQTREQPSTTGPASDFDVTVTARKREETLLDVPVSISVLDAALIEDAGILTQDEFFTLVPGIQFDQPVDRNSSSPSIRGVQASEIATNRARATQFIDGLPVLGSQGNIQFGSTEQIEVFRGPQSAAFGRSTFAGAINLVTKDPGDEFEAEATLEASDYGLRRFGGGIAGPVPFLNLGDTLGYRIDYQFEDSDAPDEFTTNEGLGWGDRSSEAATLKLVWEPTDKLTAEASFNWLESDDENRVSYLLSEEATLNCSDGTQISAMGTGPYLFGQPTCDFSQGFANQSQINRVPAFEQFLAAGGYDAAIDTYVAQFNADPTLFAGNGDNPDGTVTSIGRDQVIDNLRFLAEAESFTEDQHGSTDERTRTSLQVDYAFDNGGLVQFSAFYGEEELNRILDGAQDSRPIQFALPGVTTMGMGAAAVTTTVLDYDVQGGGAGTVGSLMVGPTELDETYAELRYVSPGDERLRYVLGASVYDYNFNVDIFDQGFSAVTGTDEVRDRFAALSLIEQEEVDGVLGDILPDSVLNETAENVGVYGNVQFDFTERLTGTFEARYQRDKVGGENELGLGTELTTNSFLPRVSVNYNLGQGTSFYAQYARGNNPAGVNVDLFNEDNIAQLNCFATDDNDNILRDADDNPIFLDGASRNEDGGIDILDGSGASIFNADGTERAIADVPILGVNGEDPCGANYVDYTAEQFQSFEEETIDSYEIGARGRLFDGAFQFATAAFYLDWQNQNYAANLVWRDPLAGGMTDNTTERLFINEGDIESYGVEFEGTWRLTDELSVRDTAALIESNYDTFCDVELIDTEIGTTDEYAQFIINNTLDVNDPDNDLGYSCVEVDGNRTENHSAVTGSLSPTYRTQLDNGLRWDMRADFRYEGPEFIDTVNAFETNPVITTNVSTGLTGDLWNLTLYVNNLFDEDEPSRYGIGEATDPYTGGATLQLAADAPEVFLITPRNQRTVGIRARFNY